MTPFGCFRAYLAMKAHFQRDDYDMFQYKGKMRGATMANFQKRNDRHRIEKLALTMNDREIMEYLLANLTRKVKWIGLFDEGCDRAYLEWRRRNEALSYNFGNEVKKLFEDAQSDGLCYNDVFVSKEAGQHPPIFTACMGGVISIETFVILERLNSFAGKMVVDVVTEDFLRTARKYDAFIKVDMEIYDSIARRIREQVFG